MKRIILLFVFLYLGNAYCASIPKSDNPRLMVKDLVSSFDGLPLEAQVANKLTVWPSSHWVNYLGSISFRWLRNQEDNFNYKLYTKEELKNLSSGFISTLSPAEKFDIYNGNYHYPTVMRMRKKHSKYDGKWEGICHGVAAAAVHHNEPEQTVLTSKDGIDITFHSSDVSGLISYYYARVLRSSTKQVGKRCYRNNDSKMACRGVNPASFHLVLANKIGLEGTSFAVDVDRYSEVWNHNVYSYNSKIIYEEQLDGSESNLAVKKLRIHTQVKYAGVIYPKLLPVIGTLNEEYFSPIYDYYLELDANNNIVGGEWLSDKRPDFLWLKAKGKFTKRWKSLNDIYVPTKE